MGLVGSAFGEPFWLFPRKVQDGELTLGGFELMLKIEAGGCLHCYEANSEGPSSAEAEEITHDITQHGKFWESQVVKNK